MIEGVLCACSSNNWLHRQWRSFYKCWGRRGINKCPALPGTIRTMMSRLNLQIFPVSCPYRRPWSSAMISGHFLQPLHLGISRNYLAECRLFFRCQQCLSVNPGMSAATHSTESGKSTKPAVDFNTQHHKIACALCIHSSSFSIDVFVVRLAYGSH